MTLRNLKDALKDAQADLRRVRDDLDRIGLPGYGEDDGRPEYADAIASNLPELDRLINDAAEKELRDALRNLRDLIEEDEEY